MTDQRKPVTRKIKYEGAPCHQGGVRVIGALGQTTHWVPVFRTNPEDAREDAEKATKEANQNGYAFTGLD